jgi:hypothetical protein
MPKIQVEENHTLGQKIALERIKNLLDSLKADFGQNISDLKENWNGSRGDFSFRAMGMKVEGQVMVGHDLVKLEGKIPLAALPFKSTIENTIREEIKKLLI